jgi:hypothetical protein
VEWLDATRAVEKKAVAESPVDTPIDRACFVGNDAVATSWHAMAPSKMPVPETIQILDAKTGSTTTVKFGKGEIPLRIIPSPGRKFVAVHTLTDVKLGAQMAVTASSNVEIFGGDGKIRNLALPKNFGLVAVPTDNDVVVGKINDFTFLDGAITVSYGGEREYDLADARTGKMVPTAPLDGAFSRRGDRVLSADKFESADKASESLVQYNITPVSKPERKREVMKSPLYITYSEVDWTPVALWEDDTHVLLSYFTPNNTEETSGTPNFQGTFDLVRYDILTNEKKTVVEGAIPFLTVAVGPGGRYFFYNTMTEKDQMQVWDVWASDADGSNRRLVWEEKGSIAFLVPEDVSPDGKRIALNLSRNTLEGYKSSVIVVQVGAAGTAPAEAAAGANGGSSAAKPPAPKESTGFHEVKKPPKGKRQVGAGRG